MSSSGRSFTQSAVAVGSTSNPTTTSGTFADLAEMSVTFTTRGGNLLCWMVVSARHSSVGAAIDLALSLDAAAEVGTVRMSAKVAAYDTPVTVVYRFSGVAAGSHTVKGRWSTTAATATADGTYRTLMVLEEPV